jgi:pilus assembly protein Flp/PilA
MQNRVGGSVAERKALIMLATLKNLFRYETGATAIEYGLIAALISVAAVTVLTTVGTNLTSTFSTVARKL